MMLILLHLTHSLLSHAPNIHHTDEEKKPLDGIEWKDSVFFVERDFYIWRLFQASIINFFTLVPQPMRSKNSKEQQVMPQRFTRSQSRRCATEKSKEMRFVEASSKKTEGLINPRIARRMKMLNEVTESVAEKCAICLSNPEEEFGSLECGHSFCMACLVRWWRHHSTCPCCREQIMFISSGGRLIYFCDLPPEEIDENQPFIAHCELCWGEVEPHEEMNICTVCRSVYWHSRCLPFRSKKWYCAECAGQEEEEEDNVA